MKTALSPKNISPKLLVTQATTAPKSPVTRKQSRKDSIGGPHREQDRTKTRGLGTRGLREIINQPQVPSVQSQHPVPASSPSVQSQHPVPAPKNSPNIRDTFEYNFLTIILIYL